MEQSSQGSQQAQKDINITYETLFEILRIEKNRDDMQELSQTFFEDVVAYLREKQQILDEGRIKQDLFSVAERDRISTEMLNIKKILRELYERREKKILIMAINKSRTRSNIIDTAKLLEEEKNLFESLVGILDRYREGIILNVLELKQPYIKLAEEKQAEQKPSEAPSLTQNPGTKLVRFLHAVPKFMGTELENYGPFEEEDMSTLPSEIADVLITKGRAEEIKEG